MTATVTDAKPGQLSKLGGHTYHLGNEELTFWSMAPEFTRYWAVDSIPGMPRSCVWLYSEKDREFVHAYVSHASPNVLAVNKRVPA